MQTYEYVVIGGGLAGGKACEGIRRVDEKGRIALVTDEPHRPYQRPPLSKGYLVGKAGLDKVYVRPDSYYAEHNIVNLSGVTATEVDPTLHAVTLEGGQRLHYGKLLLATGGRAKRLPIPGNDLAHVLTLRTIEDSRSIREAARSAERALVLGGSFIGAEVSASLAQLGISVTIAFPERRLLERVVPEELSEFLHHTYGERGVHILPGTVAQELTGDGQVAGAQLDSGQSLAIDMVVMGVGISLNTELARTAGLELTDEGGLAVDPYLRTTSHDIYGAGDIAAWPSTAFREATFEGDPKRLRVEHWDVARSQGLRAGRNMAGDERPYTTLPYFFSDLFDFSFEAWGDLGTWDTTVRRGSLERKSFAYYYFHEGRLVGALAVDRPDNERKPMQQLVRQSAQRDRIADALRDE